MKTIGLAFPLLLTALLGFGGLALCDCEKQGGMAPGVTTAPAAREPAGGPFDDEMVVIGKPFRPELPPLPRLAPFAFEESADSVPAPQVGPRAHVRFAAQ